MQEELEELEELALLQQCCLNLILILVDELVAVCCDILEVSVEAVEALIRLELLNYSSKDKLSESTCKPE